MIQNINDILLWKNSLGLLPIKQFSGDLHNGKYILLNGGNGNFCLDNTPENDSKEFYFSSAWSSSTEYFVSIENDNIVVYNWKENNVKQYLKDKVANDLAKFHANLTSNSRRTENYVVPFVISIFRKLRNLYNDKGNPLDSLNQLFLMLY